MLNTRSAPSEQAKYSVAITTPVCLENNNVRKPNVRVHIQPVPDLIYGSLFLGLIRLKSYKWLILATRLIFPVGSSFFLLSDNHNALLKGNSKFS